MIPLYLIPIPLYGPIYIYVVMALCAFTVVRYSSGDGQKLLYQKEQIPIPAIVLTVAVILFLGFRPAVHKAFADSGFYLHNYESVINGYDDPNFSSDWVFNNLMWLFKSHHLHATFFFATVELIYIGCVAVACWRLFPNNTWVAMLFCLSTFSFYSYGVNGIRNGMATSMVMLGIVLVLSSKREAIVGAFIMALAFGVHRSTMLPIAALVAALTVVKEPRWAIRFWFASIVISLVMGNYMGDFFAGLGFDDRMSKYFKGQDDLKEMEKFSSSGFRFDFLLYSAMPIVMTWYCTIKRNFRDRVFNALATTYILSNAFWVMVIRASYSNRFAYLSWFLYPLVIAYPLLRFNLWDDQDAKTARILALYAGFTFVMFLLGK